MAWKAKPAPAMQGTGLGWISSPASTRDNSEPACSVQAALAVSRLSRRFGLPLATATAVAEANSWGRA